MQAGQRPDQDGYECAQIYKEARDRILEELQAQREVNRRLGRELIDVRLELARAKMKLENHCTDEL